MHGPARHGARSGTNNKRGGMKDEKEQLSISFFTDENNMEAYHCSSAGRHRVAKEILSSLAKNRQNAAEDMVNSTTLYDQGYIDGIRAARSLRLTTGDADNTK